MKSKLLIAGTLVLAGVLLAPEAGARGRGRGLGGGAGHGDGVGFGQHLAAELELSAEQRGQIDALRDGMCGEVTEVRTALREKRREMRALWTAEQPDEQAILAKHAEMDVFRQQLRTLRVRFRLAVIELLTPEQKAKFIDGFRRSGQGRGPGYGRGWGKGDGQGWGRGYGQGRGRGAGQGLGRGRGRPLDE